MMPNRENLRLWVQALRSGEYDQGAGTLRTKDDKYCCLGVACEVAIANGVDVERRLSAVGYAHVQTYLYDNTATVLPSRVQNWLGLPINDPIVGQDEGGCQDATTANDSLDWSFNQIADGVEAYYGLKED